MKAETPVTYQSEPCGYLLVQSQQLKTFEHRVRYSKLTFNIPLMSLLLTSRISLTLF